MIAPSIDICWRIAEAEAAHAGFSEIGPAHFWIGICKAVDLELSALLDAAQPEWKVAEEQIAADLSEVKEAMVAVGISPVKLRRALRAELGRKSKATERPLHRSMALRKIFKSGSAIAKDSGESLRPAHLMVALTEQLVPELAAAMEKLELDSTEVMQELRRKISRPKTQEKRKKGKQPVAEEDEKPGKKYALERFGRDLTALAAEGALSPLIGRRAELIRMTQVLLQSRKNNLMLVGEPGVGKTGLVEGFAQLVTGGGLPEELRGTRVIEISLTALVAGTKYRGEFEERMEAASVAQRLS